LPIGIHGDHVGPSYHDFLIRKSRYRRFSIIFRYKHNHLPHFPYLSAQDGIRFFESGNRYYTDTDHRLNFAGIEDFTYRNSSPATGNSLKPPEIR